VERIVDCREPNVTYGATRTYKTVLPTETVMVEPARDFVHSYKVVMDPVHTETAYVDRHPENRCTYSEHTVREQGVVAEEITEREVRQTFENQEIIDEIQIRRVEQECLIEQIVEELVEVKQRQEVIVEQLVEVPRIIEVEETVEVPVETIRNVPVEVLVEVPKTVYVERIVEVPKIEIQTRTVEVPVMHQRTQHTELHAPILPVEVEKPIHTYRTIRRKRPVIRDEIVQVPKIIERKIVKEVIVPERVEVLKTVEVDVPVYKKVERPVHRHYETLVEVPAVKEIEVVETVEVDRMVEVPEVKVVTKTVEVDLGETAISGSYSVVNNRLPTQVRQEEAVIIREFDVGEDLPAVYEGQARTVVVENHVFTQKLVDLLRENGIWERWGCPAVGHAIPEQFRADHAREWGSFVGGGYVVLGGANV